MCSKVLEVYSIVRPAQIYRDDVIDLQRLSSAEIPHRTHRNLAALSTS